MNLSNWPGNNQGKNNTTPKSYKFLVPKKPKEKVIRICGCGNTIYKGSKYCWDCKKI